MINNVSNKNKSILIGCRKSVEIYVNLLVELGDLGDSGREPLVEYGWSGVVIPEPDGVTCSEPESGSGNSRVNRGVNHTVFRTGPFSNGVELTNQIHDTHEFVRFF